MDNAFDTAVLMNSEKYQWPAEKDEEKHAPSQKRLPT